MMQFKWQRRRKWTFYAWIESKILPFARYSSVIHSFIQFFIWSNIAQIYSYGKYKYENQGKKKVVAVKTKELRFNSTIAEHDVSVSTLFHQIKSNQIKLNSNCYHRTK